MYPIELYTPDFRYQINCTYLTLDNLHGHVKPYRCIFIDPSLLHVLVIYTFVCFGVFLSEIYNTCKVTHDIFTSYTTALPLKEYKLFQF